MKLRRMASAATAGLFALSLSVTVAAPAHADDAIAGSYNVVSPVRVLDTRSGNGAPKAPIGPLQTVTFTIPNDMSSNIGAVLLEVTAVNATAPGFLTVFGAGTPQPVVSNVNFQAKQTVPNMVAVQVSAGLQVSIFNGSQGTVDLLADIQGYFSAGANQLDPGTLVPVTPTRFLDTRSGTGVSAKGKVAPMSVTKVQIAGSAAVPADASAVAVNVTAVDSPGSGFITAYPGDPMPNASSVNFEARSNRANLVLAQIGTDGTISLYNGSPFPVDLLADVTGYFVGGTASADGSYTPSSTVRVVDTRQIPNDAVPSLATAKVQIFPAGDPYFSYIKAVAINVTAVQPQAVGFLTTWDGTTSVPAVSNVNFRAQHDAAGSIVVPVNEDGTISIYNGSFGSVQLVVDLDGLFFQLPSPDLSRAPHAQHGAPTGAQVLAKAKAFLATSHQPTIVRSR